MPQLAMFLTRMLNALATGADTGLRLMPAVV